jgi:hypothetical protein
MATDDEVIRTGGARATKLFGAIVLLSVIG